MPSSLHSPLNLLAGLPAQGLGFQRCAVIRLNEKHVGRWFYGKRILVKDPLTGRRQA